MNEIEFKKKLNEIQNELEEVEEKIRINELLEEELTDEMYKRNLLANNFFEYWQDNRELYYDISRYNEEIENLEFKKKFALQDEKEELLRKKYQLEDLEDQCYKERKKTILKEEKEN